MCNKCIHQPVCSKFLATGGVERCEHFREERRGVWEKYTDDKFMGYRSDGRIRYRKVYSYKCSKCWNYMAIKHNFCPNCGADMKGE